MDTNGNGLKYRLLPMEEWHRLAPIFARHDWFLPPEMLATAAVAENTQGQIVAGNLLQLILHAEPAWVDEAYSGFVNVRRLWGMLDDLPKERRQPLMTPGYILLAKDEHVARMAELAGFEHLEGKMFRRDWR